MNRYALSFTVQPGSEPAVAEILGSYRRPPAGAASGPPLLRRTSVFMAGPRVVRVMDVDGDIGAVMRHLAAQPQIRAVEEALDPHLSTPRDLGSADGAREFLHQALLPLASHRAGPEGQRCALLYPVRAGHGKRLARLLADGVPAVSTTTFRRGDVVVRMVEADPSAGDPLDQLARAESGAPAAAALAGMLDTRADLTTGAGLRAFLEGCRMDLLTDRRVGVPA
jgi:hypothetical protein